MHVSADERYELFVDGRRAGRGPERGDPDNWFFETYDLDLRAGEHVLVARVWSLGALSPVAQMSVQPGFILCPEAEAFVGLIGTGVAAWEAKVLGGYEFVMLERWGMTGANLVVDAARFDWGFERGEGNGWERAVMRRPGASADLPADYAPLHLMRPAMLPAMVEKHRFAGTVRHVQELKSASAQGVPVRAQDHLAAEAPAWQALVSGNAPLTVPPRTVRRVIVDLGDYYCAYPEMIATGGRGSSVCIEWAESLFTDAEGGPAASAGGKGNRDEIEGRYFVGTGDTFLPCGEKRHLETLWWKAGRYLQVTVRTADEPLTISRLLLRETRYPLEMESEFHSNDERLVRIITPALRTLQMCAHETYMDCPHWEQLHVRRRYAPGGADHLRHQPRRPPAAQGAAPVRLLAPAQRHDDEPRFPSRIHQIIPSFSLWWICMVHDYAHWRDDPDFVRSLMPGVRAVVESFLTCLNGDGLLSAPRGWNFVDWVDEWGRGAAERGSPELAAGAGAGQAAELEEVVGEAEMAARDRRLAEEIAERAGAAFWVQQRHCSLTTWPASDFSEHSQVLAILSGGLPPARRERVAGRCCAAERRTRPTRLLHALHHRGAAADRPAEGDPGAAGAVVRPGEAGDEDDVGSRSGGPLRLPRLGRAPDIPLLRNGAGHTAGLAGASARWTWRRSSARSAAPTADWCTRVARSWSISSRRAARSTAVSCCRPRSRARCACRRAHGRWPRARRASDWRRIHGRRRTLSGSTGETRATDSIAIGPPDRRVTRRSGPPDSAVVVGQPQAEGAGDGALAPAGLLPEVALAEAERARPAADDPDLQPPRARALGNAEAEAVAGAFSSRRPATTRAPASKRTADIVASTPVGAGGVFANERNEPEAPEGATTRSRTTRRRPSSPGRATRATRSRAWNAIGLRSTSHVAAAARGSRVEPVPAAVVGDRPERLDGDGHERQQARADPENGEALGHEQEQQRPGGSDEPRPPEVAGRPAPDDGEPREVGHDREAAGDRQEAARLRLVPQPPRGRAQGPQEADDPDQRDRREDQGSLRRRGEKREPWQGSRRRAARTRRPRGRRARGAPPGRPRRGRAGPGVASARERRRRGRRARATVVGWSATARPSGRPARAAGPASSSASDRTRSRTATATAHVAAASPDHACAAAASVVPSARSHPAHRASASPCRRTTAAKSAPAASAANSAASALPTRASPVASSWKARPARASPPRSKPGGGTGGVRGADGPAVGEQEQRARRARPRASRRGRARTAGRAGGGAAGWERTPMAQELARRRW